MILIFLFLILGIFNFNKVLSILGVVWFSFNNKFFFVCLICVKIVLMLLFILKFLFLMWWRMERMFWNCCLILIKVFWLWFIKIICFVKMLLRRFWNVLKWLFFNVFFSWYCKFLKRWLIVFCFMFFKFKL